jgi:arylsulfatase A-like enzyme
MSQQPMSSVHLLVLIAFLAYLPGSAHARPGDPTPPLPDQKPVNRDRKPNVIFLLADNLGWGELGCYGAGVLRGAPTPRLDHFAGQGLRLTNFNVESECSPSRCAFLTGRHAIRTGVHRTTPAGLPQGLTQWEVTLAELLSAKGYTTGLFGKWHLGDRAGRFPTDQGFDEWFGLPRTSHECQFTGAAGFDPKTMATPHTLEGRQGQKTREVAVFDYDARRRIDAEVTRRAIAFMRRSVKAARTFYAYVSFINVHFPTLPHPDFQGKTGNGDFADAVTELDHRAGQVLDAVKELGIEQETVVIFCSDNGPEFRRPWRGACGPWRGTYHTSMEGGLRAPFIIRWPGRIQSGAVSNELVHAVDLFTTVAHLGGADVPKDRPIDGIDQTAFFLGQQSHSNRDGFVLFIEDQVRAVKWRNWKLHYVWQPDAAEGAPLKLETPVLFNVLQDPKEETDVSMHHAWVMQPMYRLVHDFRESLKKYPAIPPGTPDPYQPPKDAD